MEIITIILASANAHKIEEINALLGPAFNVISMEEAGFLDDIIEDGATLEANALIKARSIHDRIEGNVLSDDSGLEVSSLNGSPGVHSARYAGSQRSHEDNMNLLIKNLEHVDDRSAQFRTVLALIMNGKEYLFEGKVAGTIISEKRGKMGFGYDPIFIPYGYDKTFAEMLPSEKNALSHRKNAVEQLIVFLKKNK